MRDRIWLGFSVWNESGLFLCGGSKLTVCRQKWSCFQCNVRSTLFLCWWSWSTLTRFLHTGRDWLGFSVSTCFLVWVVEIDLIQMWGIVRTLISFKGSQFICFVYGFENDLLWVSESEFTCILGDDADCRFAVPMFCRHTWSSGYRAYRPLCCRWRRPRPRQIVPERACAAPVRLESWGISLQRFLFGNCKFVQIPEGCSNFMCMPVGRIVRPLTFYAILVCGGHYSLHVQTVSFVFCRRAHAKINVRRFFVLWAHNIPRTIICTCRTLIHDLYIWRDLPVHCHPCWRSVFTKKVKLMSCSTFVRRRAQTLTIFIWHFCVSVIVPDHSILFVCFSFHTPVLFLVWPSGATFGMLILTSQAAYEYSILWNIPVYKMRVPRCSSLY